MAYTTSLDGFGWKVEDSGLHLTRMAQKHAPHVILELVSCGCKKKKCALASGCLRSSHGVQCGNICVEGYGNEEDRAD